MKEDKDRLNRRNFLKTVGAVGAAGMLIGCKGKEAKQPDANDVNAPGNAQKTTLLKMPRRKLGKTGIEVPVLALGGAFNFLENQIILEKSFQWGVNYWDTASDYAGQNSELGIGKFLSKDPEARKKLFIATKASDAVTVADAEKSLKASLKRMNTKYIDLYHIMDRIAGPGYVGHGLSDPAKLTDDLREWVKSAKKRKLIRLFGFSTHKNMAKCLTAAAKLGWIDVIMLVYNFRLMQDDELNTAIDACHKAGIGLVAMKVLGNSLRTEKDQKMLGHFLQRGFTEEQAKIKVVLEDKRFGSACVKMQNVAYLTSNVAAVLDKTKLSEADRQIFKEYAQASCSDYCACCAYICDSALPDVSCISDIMRYLMYYNSYGDKDRARELFAQIPGKVRNKLLGLDYRLVQARCPQHLPIGQLVAEAVSKLA